MGFAPHGHYELEVQGEIFITRFYQAWNLEGAKAFFEAYKSLILECGFRRFGVLGNLMAFEGGPPEVMAFFEKIAQWTRNHGQVARAQVVDSELITHMVHQPSDGKSFFSIQTFKDEETALAWLADQGLAIS